VPPPESTGLEGLYLQQAQLAARPVVAHLRDGAQVRGAIEYFDRDLIKIQCEDGPGLVLRKCDIRYLSEG
jgi:hypothetical protein